MEDDIFSHIDSLIAEADSSEPKAVAKYYHITYIELRGTIGGYATLFGPQPVIGVNVKQSDMWQKLGGWHELAHVFDGHIYEPGFQKGCVDGTFFNADYDSKTISRHERTANLVAAHVYLEDKKVLDKIGYNDPLLQQYRRAKAYRDSLMRELEGLRCSTFRDEQVSSYQKIKTQNTYRKFRIASESLSDLEAGLVYSDCCKTFSEIAASLNVDERILRYKLESMRLRGFDIDPQELEHYSRMFDRVM